MKRGGGAILRLDRRDFGHLPRVVHQLFEAVSGSRLAIASQAALTAPGP